MWTQGQGCLIVEDVITSGGSVADTVKVLRDHGMKVSQCVVLLDREQGGRSNLEKLEVAVTSILSISQVLKVLFENKRITSDTVSEVKQFIENNQTSKQIEMRKEKINFSEKLSKSKNNVTKKLLQIVLEKMTNVCVAVDCVSSKELLTTAEALGPYVAVVKIHQDIVKDWNRETEQKLRSIANSHNFLIFEDRKYADIGNTVTFQAQRCKQDLRGGKMTNNQIIEGFF